MHTGPGIVEIDFAVDAENDRLGEDGVQRVGFHELAVAAKSPLLLVTLLRQMRCETVRVCQQQTLPLSAVQALALTVAGLIPARRWQLAEGGGVRERTRSGYLGLALARLAPAIARELAQTLRLGRVARVAADREYHLPRSTGTPRSALYVRADPAIGGQGRCVGGAATHAAGVINALADAGLDVHVVAPERPAGTRGIELSTVAPRRVLHLVPGLSNTDYSQAIAGSVAGEGVDFVYQRHLLGGFAGLELAQRLGVPLVLEFNGSEIWVQEQWGGGRIRMKRTLAALERRNLLDASLIVAVSEVLRDHLLAKGVDGRRVLVNPNGVDVEQLASYRRLTPREWRLRNGHPSDVTTIGFVGTFESWHGVELLPDLIEATPSMQWIVVGAGEPLYTVVRGMIEGRGIQDRVAMPGLVAREHALELMGGCDICISPHVANPDGSRFFGSPTKLFEYMGLAKAIVASDLEQIGAVIRDGHNGLLHRPGDIAATVAAIERLAGDAELRLRLGAAALADAEERFSWQAHVRRITQALAGQAALNTTARAREAVGVP